MQVGMHAMSAYNGVAGVAQMFGYPLPKVPKKLREGAQSSVELLKQESSVAAFGAIHEKVEAKDETNETVRGASLRELQRLLMEKDSDKNYAGLRRIGDDDGTAVWTLLTDPEDVNEAIEKRAAQRRAEARRRDDYVKSLMINNAAGGGADAGAAAPVAEAAPKAAETQAAAQSGEAAAPPRAVKAWAWASRFEARMMKLEDKLDATAAGGGHAAARALEARLARIEETLQEVAARPSKNS